MNKILNISIVIVILLVAFQFLIGGSVCADNDKFAFLEEKKALLLKENRIYDQKIAELSSLIRIKTQAELLGFKDNSIMVGYSSADSVALRP